jgi:predicted RNA-binding protein with PUA-like domain
MKTIHQYDKLVPLLGSAKLAWEKLIEHIETNYEMDEVWYEGKPDSNYRNNVKLRRGGKTLITVYFRDGYFKVEITLGKTEREKYEQQQETFSDSFRKLYDNTQTLHDGKWLVCDVRDETPLDDIIRLLHIKRKSNRKAVSS